VRVSAAPTPGAADLPARAATGSRQPGTRPADPERARPGSGIRPAHAIAPCPPLARTWRSLQPGARSKPVPGHALRPRLLYPAAVGQGRSLKRRTQDNWRAAAEYPGWRKTMR